MLPFSHGRNACMYLSKEQQFDCMSEIEINLIGDETTELRTNLLLLPFFTEAFLSCFFYCITLSNDQVLDVWLKIDKIYVLFLYILYHTFLFREYKNIHDNVNVLIITWDLRLQDSIFSIFIYAI